jgi:hypothetical protein
MAADPEFFMSSDFFMSEYLVKKGFVDATTIDALKKHEGGKLSEKRQPFATKNEAGSRPVEFMKEARQNLYEPTNKTLLAARPFAIAMLKEHWSGAISGRLKHNVPDLLSPDGKWCLAKQTPQMQADHRCAPTNTDAICESPFAVFKGINGTSCRFNHLTVAGLATAKINNFFAVNLKRGKGRRKSGKEGGRRRRQRTRGVVGAAYGLGAPTRRALTLWTVRQQRGREQKDREMRKGKRKRENDAMEATVASNIKKQAKDHTTAVAVTSVCAKLTSAAELKKAMDEAAKAVVGAAAKETAKQEVCKAQIRWRTQGLHTKFPATVPKESLVMSVGGTTKASAVLASGLKAVFSAEAVMTDIPAAPAIRAPCLESIATLGTPSPQRAEMTKLLEQKIELAHAGAGVATVTFCQEMPALQDLVGKAIKLKCPGGRWVDCTVRTISGTTAAVVTFVAFGADETVTLAPSKFNTQEDGAWFVPDGQDASSM